VLKKKIVMKMYDFVYFVARANQKSNYRWVFFFFFL